MGDLQPAFPRYAAKGAQKENYGAAEFSTPTKKAKRDPNATGDYGDLAPKFSTEMQGDY